MVSYWFLLVLFQGSYLIVISSAHTTGTDNTNSTDHVRTSSDWNPKNNPKSDEMMMMTWKSDDDSIRSNFKSRSVTSTIHSPTSRDVNHRLLYETTCDASVEPVVYCDKKYVFSFHDMNKSELCPLSDPNSIILATYHDSDTEICYPDTCCADNFEECCHPKHVCGNCDGKTCTMKKTY
jgi:hypothetical protein